MNLLKNCGRIGLTDDTVLLASRAVGTGVIFNVPEAGIVFVILSNSAGLLRIEYLYARHAVFVRLALADFFGQGS